MSLIHAAGTPLVAIVIGTVLGVVFLILVIVLVFHIVKTVRKHRVAADSPEGSEMGLPNYGIQQPVNRRFWQDRGNSMQVPQASPLHDAYNHQRMSHISKALGRFSNIVSSCTSSTTVVIAVKPNVSADTSRNSLCVVIFKHSLTLQFFYNIIIKYIYSIYSIS